MKAKIQSASLYFIVASLLCVWWWKAFYVPAEMAETPAQIVPLKEEEHPLLLSDLKRSDLLQALQGDYPLMVHLLLEWDLDAQITHRERLAADELLRAQVLGRILGQRPQIDSSHRFLPQTYASASILLALLPPKHIVALPKGFRKQVQMYPLKVTAQIPLDADRLHAELLYLARPDKAFVSSYYSHPSTLQALKDQGIALEMMKHSADWETIEGSILQIGKSVDCNEQAELLVLFMRGTLLALRNRLNDKSKNKLTYVTYYDRFYSPHAKAPGVLLLAQLGVYLDCPKTTQLLEREALLKLNPHCLLISSPDPEKVKKNLLKDPSFQCKNFFVLDDEILQTPTHYIVLAGYDFVDALMRSP